MKNTFIIISAIIITILCTISCNKAPAEPSIDEIIFQEMYDNLELGCEEHDVDDYFKATINGVECCYYDGVNNMRKDLSYANVTVTESPTLIIGEGSPEFLGHTIHFGIELNRTTGEKYQNWVQFYSPLFAPGISKEAYLDSIFAIERHEIAGMYNADGFTVKLSMWKKRASQVGSGAVYSFYSTSGLQSEDSYLRFVKAEKKSAAGITFYDIEMEVECELYYLITPSGHAQYGEEGLWSRLEDGILKMKVLL